MRKFFEYFFRVLYLVVFVAIPAFIIYTVIFTALCAPARGTEIVKANDHFFTATQLKALCDSGSEKCGGYVFGVIDTLTSSLECKGTAGQITSNEVATYLNKVLETTRPEILNKVSGAAMVSFAFSQTTVSKRCVAESKGI